MGSQAEGRAELPGDFYGSPQIRAPDLCHDPERDDEAARDAVPVERDCPVCKGKRLKPEALSVKFAGVDISELSRLPLKSLDEVLMMSPTKASRTSKGHPEKALVVKRIVDDLRGRLEVLLDLGLGYLTLERSTPTLSPGELQRLRLATQVRSNLFGVAYVLDEPSAGLHPADAEALLRAMARLKPAGNSLFVVEHELDVVRQADWIVDVGSGAGEKGGRILFSGPLPGLADVGNPKRDAICSDTRRMPPGAAVCRKNG